MSNSLQTSDLLIISPQHFAHGVKFNYFAMVHNFDCAADVALPLLKVYTRPCEHQDDL